MICRSQECKQHASPCAPFAAYCHKRLEVSIDVQDGIVAVPNDAHLGRSHVHKLEVGGTEVLNNVRK